MFVVWKNRPKHVWIMSYVISRGAFGRRIHFSHFWSDLRSIFRLFRRFLLENHIKKFEHILTNFKIFNLKSHKITCLRCGKSFLGLICHVESIYAASTMIWAWFFNFLDPFRPSSALLVVRVSHNFDGKIKKKSSKKRLQALKISQNDVLTSTSCG